MDKHWEYNLYLKYAWKYKCSFILSQSICPQDTYYNNVIEEKPSRCFDIVIEEKPRRYYLSLWSDQS